jgi:hypothetical protein
MSHRSEPWLPTYLTCWIDADAKKGASWAGLAAGRGRMKMLDDSAVALDADHCLVLVSPRLVVWRVGLPGVPDCCQEHACQTR